MGHLRCLIGLIQSAMMPSPPHITTLLHLHALCSHSLNHPHVILQLAASFLAARELRKPAAGKVDDFLAMMAAHVEAAKARLGEGARLNDESALFAADRAIGHLRQLVLTALGVLEGTVVLFPRRREAPEHGERANASES